MKQANEDAAEAIVLECELAEAPQQVWRALTERELLAAWLMPNDFRAELGADFSFQPPPELEDKGPITCKVLALEPPRLLRFSWREAEAGDAAPGSLSFVLTPTETGGTHLRLVHRAAAPALQLDARESAPRQLDLDARESAPCLGRLLHLPTSSHIAGSKPPESMRCAA
jgi:uncharacterized protein YndB with AHSA1/START domain